jgi:hypothetical protein
MGIMPHDSVDEALRLAFFVDIPFWPQLPKLSFYEDMYVQAMEYFLIFQLYHIFLVFS